MAPLISTAYGQVMFRKDVLQHLGIRAGEKIKLKKLANGPGDADRCAGGKIDRFVGFFADKSSKVAILAEIDETRSAGGTETREYCRRYQRAGNALTQVYAALI